MGKHSYSGGTPPRIALAILGVQSTGFALFYWKKWFVTGQHAVKMQSDLDKMSIAFWAGFV